MSTIGTLRAARPVGQDTSGRFPEFVPFPGLGNGHVQTVAGRYALGRPRHLPADRQEVDLRDGDRLVYLESTPPDWRAGDPITILVHGLGGCAESPYVVRMAARIQTLGARVARINQRGAGGGFGLARGIYHAGRTEDLWRAAEDVAARAPGSPLVLLGFSLGGNLVLKLAAEAAHRPAPWLDSVLAVNPPIDLQACCNHLRSRPLRLYDRHFVRMLRRAVDRLHAHFPDLGPVDWRPVRTLYDFDEHYTAPRNGFHGAADYYRRCSAAPSIPEIDRPGLVIHAADDPFIPVAPFLSATFPDRLEREITRNGGHIGYLGRNRLGPDRRWLDARIGHWLSQRWQTHEHPAGAGRSTLAPHGGANLYG